jgi:hypothetical protein
MAAVDRISGKRSGVEAQEMLDLHILDISKPLITDHQSPQCHPTAVESLAEPECVGLNQPWEPVTVTLGGIEDTEKGARAGMSGTGS